MENPFNKELNLKEQSLSLDVLRLKEKFIKELSESGYLSYSAEQIIEQAPELLENTEVLNEAQKIIIDKLIDGDIYSALSIKNKLLKGKIEILRNQKVVSAAKEAFTNKLFSDEIEDTEINDAKSISEEFLTNNREIVIEVAQKAFIRYFNIKKVEHSVQIKQDFLQDQGEFFKSEEIVLKAKELFIQYLSIGYEDLKRIREDYLSDQRSFFESKEVISAAKKGVLSQMKFSRGIDIMIKEEYLSNYPDFFKSDEVINKAKECFLNALSSGGVYSLIEIKNNYLLEQQDFFKSDEVMSAIKGRFYLEVSSNLRRNSAKEVAKEFLGDQPEIVNEIAKKVFSENLNKGDVSGAEEIKRYFLNDENGDFVIQESKESFIEFIKGLYYGVDEYVVAVEIKEKFLSNQQSFFESDEVISAIKKGLKNRIKNKEYFDSIKKIRDSFLSGHPEIIGKLIEEALLDVLTSNNYNIAKDIKEEFINEYPSVFESKGVLIALKDYLTRGFSRYGSMTNHFDPKKIKNDFLLNHDEFITQATHEALAVLLSKLGTNNGINKQEVFDTMRKLKSKYPDIFTDTEVLFQAEQNLNKAFSFKDYSEFQDIINEFFRSDVEQLILSFLLKKLFESVYTENNNFENIKIELESRFPEYKESNRFRSVFEEELFDKLETGKVFDAVKLQKNFPEFKIDVLNDKEKLQQIKDSFIRALEDGSTGVVLEYIDEFLGDEYKNFGDLRNSALKCLEQIKDKGTIGDENMIIIARTFLQDEIGSLRLNKIIVESILVESLPGGNVDVAKNNADYFLKNYSFVENIQDILQSKLLGASYKVSREDFVAIFGEVLPKEAEEENLTYIENIQNYFSNQGKDRTAELMGEEKYKRIFENLKGLEDTAWDQEGNNHEIANAFVGGVKVFGYEKMFGFIGTYDRHDALFSFPAILILQEKSKLSSEQFYGQILYQVKMDGSVSNDRDSYQRLNDVAKRFENINFQEVLNEASEYREVTSMGELLEQIKSTEDVFSNWKTLKKFDEIVDLLKKKELLEQLKNLPEEEQKLKMYIETLIFHPNINTSAVMKFWQDPAGALGVYDEHSDRTHQLKKPSNYTDIPYLQLDAINLRDALVNRDIDKIQTFEPMEIIFKVPTNSEYRDLSIVELTKKALGSFKEGVKGEAQNSKKLFSEIQKVLKSSAVDLQKFLSGETLLEPEIEKQIKDLLLTSESGLKLKMKEYRAKISEKSDPDAVVAGNDTACCMPFGSGKNNVYTYNPNCGQFLVQKNIGKGKWKTIAQSVLTKDVDIKIPIPEIIGAASLEHKSMNDLVSDDILKKQKEVIVCDNIEVAPNAGTSRDDLQTIYREFFKQYLNTNDSNSLNQSEFLVGLGYNDLIFGESVKNTFLPIAPVGYSDNIGYETKKVSLTEKSSVTILKNVIQQTVRVNKERKLTRGIRELTFADTLKVSYIEGKAYADNQSLMEYMHNMENGLIAKDIYNAQNDRPNMSFKYENSENKTEGYIFAYEGEMDGEEILYITDMAVIPESKLAGGRLMNAFVNEYDKNYLKRGNYVPIFAQARDKTSYKIVEKQLNRIGKKVGIEFKMEEVNSYHQGNDEMHEIIIRPIKK